MKKNYSLLLIIFVFSFFFSFTSQAQLVANTDNGNVIRSNDVQIAIENVLGNDTLNGIPVTLSNVTITQISTSANISLQPNGSVIVNAGATPGLNEISYQICEIANPNNCRNAPIFVRINPVPPTPIILTQESVTISTGLATPQIIIENVLDNDTFGSIPITISDVTIQQTSSTTSTYFNIDTATGNILLVGNPPPGTYAFPYNYCMVSQPNNCVQGTANITVVNSLRTGITGTYQDFNADGVTNVGDVINYTYTITNIGTQAVTNISISSTEANINGGPPIPNLNTGGSDSATYTGIHVITQEDINSGHVIVSIDTNGTRSGNPITVTTTNTVNLNISSGIRLNAFIDYNGNGTQDSGEPNFTTGSFQYQLNDNGTTHNIISANGIHYIYETNPVNSYDFGFTIDPDYANRYSVATASYSNVTVPNGSGISTYNFALTALPFSDLDVYMFEYGRPRPGFTYTVEVMYRNYGNQTAASATLTVAIDSRLSLISTNPAGGVVNGNNITFNLTNLQPGAYGYFLINLQVPTIPTVQLGDLLNTTATITTPANDIYPYNNTRSITSMVVGSYDPNDKTESHGPQIQHSTFSASDYLTYTIRFENTGTAEAINVRVNDVLNNKLDETTVKMVAASHPYVLDRVGSNLTWKFDGINLEPSIPNNPIIGHGYVVFKVKPKPGYVIGDVIPNSASIYFDFNPAIVTNPWTTSFVLALNNADFTFDNFTYYPNPVSNILTISNNENMETVEITSVLGQKVRSLKVNAMQAEIDFSDLTTGMYFVKVTSEGHEKTVKVIKK